MELKPAKEILAHLLTPYRQLMEEGGCLQNLIELTPILPQGLVELQLKGEVLYILSPNTTLLHYLRHREPEIWAGIEALHRHHPHCREVVAPKRLLFRFRYRNRGE